MADCHFYLLVKAAIDYLVFRQRQSWPIVTVYCRAFIAAIAGLFTDRSRQPPAIDRPGFGKGDLMVINIKNVGFMPPQNRSYWRMVQFCGMAL